MKYFLMGLSVVVIACVIMLCPIKTQSEVQSVQYLRIHIRANSNSEEDQTVKYKVKDNVVDSLIPLLKDAKTFDRAKKIVEENFSLIEKTANQTLKENGFSYTSCASLKREYFPTRTYDDLTLEEGLYDALILNLGSGQGNNWWCLVFPAFCFTSSTNFDNIEYISIIWEIIKSVTQGGK